jgi:hypothetical protein
MKHIHRTAATVLGLLASLLALTVTGTAAFAQVPLPDPSGPIGSATVPASTSHGAQGLGSLPSWQVALAALAIALIAACLTMLVERVAVAQRRATGVVNP